MKRIMFFLCVLFVTPLLYSQETITAAGGEATGSGTASYSIGQIVYSNNTGSNGSVSQGVQQAYTIVDVVGLVGGLATINLELAAYPNPTNNALTLNIGNYNNQNLTYRLCDMQGKLLDSRKVNNSSTEIGMQNLPASTYLLNIVDSESLIKTFRIIKN
ncbi:T9SS type A sorting domain-containing protein [Salibacteraceae bacterium]|nr:T9SS type A sorting domain-containing protein [Salibacteraceae bacterium]